MTREILFRGKDVKTGEWRLGDLIQSSKKCFIVIQPHIIFEMHGEFLLTPSIWYEVDPNTVGQYLGIEDRKKRKIFDKDKVSCHVKCPNLYYVRDNEIKHYGGGWDEWVTGEISTSISGIDVCGHMISDIERSTLEIIDA